MSKLKVGNITIESGQISFQQQSSSQQVQQTNLPSHVPQTQLPEQASLTETIDKLPNSNVLWFGGGALAVCAGVVVPMMYPLLPFLAIPIVSLGFFFFGVGVLKIRFKNNKKIETKAKIQHAQQEHKELLLNLLKKKNIEWTFEQIAENIALQQEEILLALKSCIEEQLIEEELNTDTAEWFYVLQKEKNKERQPQSLDERLKNLKS